MAVYLLSKHTVIWNLVWTIGQLRSLHLLPDDHWPDVFPLSLRLWSQCPATPLDWADSEVFKCDLWSGAQSLWTRLQTQFLPTSLGRLDLTQSWKQYSSRIPTYVNCWLSRPNLPGKRTISIKITIPMKLNSRAQQDYQQQYFLELQLNRARRCKEWHLLGLDSHACRTLILHPIQPCTSIS